MKVNEIGKFWVVTKAGKKSTLADILFETGVPGIMKQALGGLTIPEVQGVFKSKVKAEKFAKKFLPKTANTIAKVNILYKKDRKLAKKVAAVLGYKIFFKN